MLDDLDLGCVCLRLVLVTQMKAIVYLASRNNSQNCISIYDDIISIKACVSAKMCIYGDNDGCGMVIIDEEHLRGPAKVEIIP